MDICNEGNYPANEVSVTCGICIGSNNGKLHYLSLRKEEPAIPSILFPSEEISACFEETPNDSLTVNIAPNDELTVEVVVRYKNKLTNENHKTVRVWLSAPIVSDSNELIPSTNKDYWD